MANNFYRSIDVAFDRFEVKQKIQPFFLNKFLFDGDGKLKYVFFYSGVCKE